MKTRLLGFGLTTLLFIFSTNAQVGVGNTNPQAQLDISASSTTSPANNDGILIPRMNAFPSTPGAARDGMLIFYTGTGADGKGFYYWNQTSTSWEKIASGGKNTLDEAYDEGGPGTGRIINATDGMLTISGQDGLLITGAGYSTTGAIIPTLGEGSRMLFSPSKAAFRAGEVRGNFGSFNTNVWNEANIGEYSFAVGLNPLASAQSSIALGVLARSTANDAVAIGRTTQATANSAFAFGSGTSASGLHSTAGGFASLAIGDFSFAIGRQAAARSYGEIVLGNFPTVYSPISTTSFINADRMFTVANGTLSTPSNALTIFKSGLMNINDEYNMPIIDGSAGQVMTTDGTGNVTFQNIVGDGIGTDNQTIDNLSLLGTTLRLSLEDDGQPLQTVNLASLQDGTGTDDQNIQNLGFNASTNILTVGIENGTAQTVNLSALDSGGDINQVNAGNGLTGGGATGTVTVNAVGVNGITTNANDFRLGGTLIQNTAITQGTFDLIHSLNSTGEFIIRDGTLDVVRVDAAGVLHLGDDTTWRDGNATGGTIIAQLLDDGDDGQFRLLENGSPSIILDANGASVFNEQSLDRDFRIESQANSGMFFLDAANSRVSVGAVNNIGTFNVTGNSYYSDDLFLRDGGVTSGDILARLYDNFDDGVLDIYQNNIVNHRLHGNGLTVFNEQGAALNDFRIESDTRPFLFWIDASDDIVRIGTNPTGGLAENGNTRTVAGLSTTINYAADIQIAGSNRNTTTGIGSTEFLHDAGNLYVMLHGRLLPYDDGVRSLGTSNWRWQSLWAVDGTINTSDLRQKKNIKPLTYGLEELMEVETLTYKWKESTNKATKIGFSAQNLLEVLPEVVATEESVTIDEETGAEEMRPVGNLGVYYSDIIPVTVKAIQELNDKVEALEAENLTLKQQIDKLKNLEARLLALEKNTSSQTATNSVNIESKK